MLRRRGESSHDENGTKRFRSEDVEIEYCGYKLTLDDPNPIDTLSSEVSPLKFFQDYITKRKPVILDFSPSFPNNEKSTDSDRKNDQSWKVNPSTLRSVAGEEFVQVEKRRHSKESFGQRRTKSRQLKMKISQFLDCLCGNDEADPELYYLSTQQAEYDNSSNISDSLQTPCCQLAHGNFIPSYLPIAGNMSLHSCNLWMGASRIGSSSGLHHDFHDNFYVLLKGTKRFRLFSPDSALSMHTKGSIHKIYSNGMISYVGSETRRGFPLASLEINGKHPDESHSNNLDCNDGHMTEEETDEEECIIGKGFDYESSEEEEEEGGGGEIGKKRRTVFLSDHDEDGDVEHDDYDALESNDDQSHDEDEEEGLEPPADSFSKIPISVLNDKGKLAQDFPDFARCPTCEIELRAGQCLYLPTGWFHEVVSLSKRNEVHIAVNFWYSPPDNLASFDAPYAEDNFLKAVGR